MNIVSILVALIIIGFVSYMLYSVPIPMNPWFKNLIMGIVMIAALVWLLNLFGLHPGVDVRFK